MGLIATGDPNYKWIQKIIRHIYAKNQSEASIHLPFGDPLTQEDPKPQIAVVWSNAKRAAFLSAWSMPYFFSKHWMFPTARGGTVHQTYFLAFAGTAFQVKTQK